MAAEKSENFTIDGLARPRRIRPPLSVRTLFWAMALLLVATVAVTYWIGQVRTQYGRSLLRVHNTVDALNVVLSTLKDAETGQRGYLLTGNSTYLSPYTSAVGRVDGQLADLDVRVNEGLLDKDDVSRLRELCHEKMAELKLTIDQQRGPEGSAAALATVKSNVGKQTMDDIRTLITRMIDQGEQRQLDIEKEIERITDIHTLAFAATAAVNLLFLAWAFNQIQQEMRRRERVAADLARQQRLTAVTLASIGDGVIVTDARGDIVFMNAIAEQLTGWTSAEAGGQPCGVIFRIVNETTHKPVPNPVEKVLETGVVQGLANHTVLIRKDGSELPIDDSGAPIRGDDGIIHGVVLVFRDFTERKQFEQNLQHAKEEAESANVAKDNFLAVLSHELRTPLTPVVVTLTSWTQNPSFPVEFREDLGTLRRCAELEARLIDDLLDLTRIVRGKLALHMEAVDVHAMLDGVTRIYRSDLNAKSIVLEMHLNAQSRYVMADAGRLQQVFWNVLKNAAKFTPAGGKIEIKCLNPASGRVEINITDSGTGMTPETIKRIFQPFEQGSAEIVRQYGGLGLGLSLSKAFVQAHGGTIAAASEGPGKGSTFTISMPTTSAPVMPAMPSSKPGSAPKPSGPGGSARPLRILLVEDHDDTSRVMSRLLERLGHQVRTADSVASALVAAEEPFDLLLSDIGLPDGTGIDLIQQLRQRGKNDFPAVALTGFGMEEDILKTREAGFTDHLTKPINFQRLQGVVQKIAEG
jgi:PAS domain S-box-containing protein